MVCRELAVPGDAQQVIRPFVTCFTPSATELAKNSLGGPLGGEKKKRGKKTYAINMTYTHIAEAYVCLSIGITSAAQ